MENVDLSGPESTSTQETGKEVIKNVPLVSAKPSISTSLPEHLSSMEDIPTSGDKKSRYSLLMKSKLGESTWLERELSVYELFKAKFQASRFILRYMESILKESHISVELELDIPDSKVHYRIRNHLGLRLRGKCQRKRDLSVD